MEGDRPVSCEQDRPATRITVEEVDLALLRQAARLLATDDTAVVDQALAELIREHQRRRAVAAELHRYETGQFRELSGGNGGIR